MTEPAAPSSTSDPELEQALERARTTNPAGAGLNKGTLALAALVLAGGGFLGGYLVGGSGAGAQLSGPWRHGCARGSRPR